MDAPKLFCPKCRENNQKSRVYCGGTSSTLLAGPRPYWDEDGNHVVPPDPNTRTTEYWCSNNHRFTIARRDGQEDRLTVLEDPR